MVELLVNDIEGGEHARLYEVPALPTLEEQITAANTHFMTMHEHQTALDALPRDVVLEAAKQAVAKFAILSRSDEASSEEIKTKEILKEGWLDRLTNQEKSEVVLDGHIGKAA